MERAAVQAHPYPVANAGDEGLDVQLRRARLLTRSICTLEAARGLPQSGPLTQSGVLDIIKVALFTGAGLRRGRGWGRGWGEKLLIV